MWNFEPKVRYTSCMVHHLLLLKTCQVYCDEHYPYLYHDGLLILYIPTMHYDFSFKRNVRMEWVLDCILWNYYGLTFSEYIHWDYVIFNWQNNVLTCLKLFIIFQVPQVNQGESCIWDLLESESQIITISYLWCIHIANEEIHPPYLTPLMLATFYVKVSMIWVLFWCNMNISLYISCYYNVYNIYIVYTNIIEFPNLSSW